jgi:hypothetical protein
MAKGYNKKTEAAKEQWAKGRAQIYYDCLLR